MKHNRPAMPNIATVFKEEIARLARKEVRRETASLKKAAAAHRGDIAKMKRRLQTLEQALKRAQKQRAREAPAASNGADGGDAALRFRAKGLASLRERLGLSARECGLLLGVSGQSVYLWESGRARPSAKHLNALASLRKLGKREVAARLEAAG
jgi:DNA-binding transcriptional regulator YiaG